MKYPSTMHLLTFSNDQARAKLVDLFLTAAKHNCVEHMWSDISERLDAMRNGEAVDQVIAELAMQGVEPIFRALYDDLERADDG